MINYKQSLPDSYKQHKKGGNAMFLGFSLTIWLVILGVFAIVTPIVGKQVAKDALEIKDELNTEKEPASFILFPVETLLGKTEVDPTHPIQTLTEKQYIKQMMMGGVYGEFLSNFAFVTVVFATAVIGFIIYPIAAFFRGIFSTK